MISMPTKDMLMLPAGDVENPTKVGRVVTTGTSFQNIVSGGDPMTREQSDGTPLLLGAGQEVPFPEHFSSQSLFSMDIVVPEGTAPPIDDVVPQVDETSREPSNPEIGQNPKVVLPIPPPNTIEIVTAPMMARDAMDWAVRGDDVKQASPLAMHLVEADSQSFSVSKLPLTPIVSQQIGQQPVPFAQNSSSPEHEQALNGLGQPQMNVPTIGRTDISVPEGFQSAAQLDLPVQQPLKSSGDASVMQMSQLGSPALQQPLTPSAKSQGSVIEAAYGTAQQRLIGAPIGNLDGATPIGAPNQSDLPRHDLTTASYDTALETTGAANKLTALSDAAPLQAPSMPKPAQLTNAPETLAVKSDLSTREISAQPAPPAGAPTQPIVSSMTPLQPAVLSPDSAVRSAPKGDVSKSKDQPISVPTARVMSHNSEIQNGTVAQAPPVTQTPETTQNVATDFTAFPEVAALEMQGVDSLSTTRLDTSLNRPEVMRHVAQQLAGVARQMPDRPIELTLNPEELGRVRLTFTTTDGGISVAVIAERGDTMDLLRRHIDTLAQEFRDLGYKDVNFDFSRSGAERDQSGSDGNSSNQDQTTSPDTPPADSITPVQLSLDPSAGLDLRL